MEKFDRGVSLLSWAYNEEDSIAEFLTMAQALMEKTVSDYEIVLIDDASTDNTLNIAKSFQLNNPRIVIFKNERNLNVGISSSRAIQKATKEYLFWQTIDWSYDISNLRTYLEYLKIYDIVQGVRRRPVTVKFRLLKSIMALMKLFGIKHLTRRSDTVFKAVVSVVNYIVIRILFAVPLSDFQNVTFYSTKWIQSLRLEARSSFANPEGLIKSYWNGMSIKEVPISFIPRKLGKGTGTHFNAIFNSVVDILRLWCKWILLGRRDTIKLGEIIRLDHSTQYDFS